MSTPQITPKATIYITLSTDVWTSMDDVAKACKGKPVSIKGTTLDLKGCQLNGSRLPQPKDDQDESSAPLRINIPGFILKNGSVRKIPGGLVMRKKGVTVEKVVFLETGEDAISNVMDDSENMTIRHCRFYGARDKAVQMNDARGLVLEDNEFEKGTTGARIQKTGSKYKKLRTKSVKRNRFVDVDTAFNVSGGIVMTESGNTFVGVNTRFKVNNGADVISA